MKIGIMGAGSIGCFLGACLLKAGHQVVFVGRKSQQEAIAQHGLKITTLTGKGFSLLPTQITYKTEAEALQNCELVLLTVKIGSTEEASQSMREHLREGATIISFQNGVSNAERIEKVLAGKPVDVWAGMVPYNVVNLGNGHFHQGTSGELVFAHHGEKSDRICQMLQQAGLVVHTSQDMQAVLWGKLMLNLNNALNALAGVPIREELNQPIFRRILARAIAEGLATLKQAGIKPQKLGKAHLSIIPHVLRLPTWLFRIVASSMIKIDPQARSSMWEDLERKRMTEIDYLNGEIVRLAQQHNIQVPCNETIVKLIREAEQKRAGSPCLPASQIWQMM